MMKVKIILLFLMLYSLELFSQIKLHSIAFYADYSYPTKKRLLVTKIDAVGGGVDISFQFFKYLMVTFNGGYSLFSLQQERAIEQWNWRFYTERYRGIIQDNLRADSTLAAYLNPIQKMDLMPIAISLKGEVSPLQNFYVRPQVGLGIFFYTRRLYLEEVWRKKFEEADYTFEYSYRNFAQDKYGNPISTFTGIELAFKPSEIFTIGSSLGYYYFFKTPGKLGFDQFPIEDYINFKIYLTFLY